MSLHELTSMDSFDERFRKACKEFPEIRHINERVEKYEEVHGLTPFTPQEILDQRKIYKKIRPLPSNQHRICKECGKWMGPQAVCTSCFEGRKGYRTRWVCMNSPCGAIIYSKRTLSEWISQQSN